jgi:exonuclease III
MRIVTYNFRAGGKRGEQNQWSKILIDFAPDIVFAQETRHPKLEVPENYQINEDRFVWQPANSRWGSAVFIRDGEIKPLDVPGFEGWVVGAEISESNWFKARQRPLRLFSVHAPSRKGSSYIKEMNLILDQIAELSDNADLIIGGDFNITASFRHDSEAMKTGRANEKILTRLSDEFRLKSCWQAANPDQPLAQTLRWGSNKISPYHCDGIIAPIAWGQLLGSCQVISEGWAALSDHNPVVATFEMTKRENV